MNRIKDKAVTFSLSSGRAGNGPQCRKVLAALGGTAREVYLLMDRAYEGDAIQIGYIYVVHPKGNREAPWEHDKTLYKARNQN